jgi:uncharacterized damage-inducible protein DinB
MVIDVLIQLYERDLAKLRTEIEQYSNEADLWKTSGEITNSAGNLALHLMGNLKHFFGAVLGNSGYVRDRDLEFSVSGVSKERLLAEVAAAAADVRKTLENLTEDDLAKDYPLDVFGYRMTTEFFVIHLTTHFNYHLGQINYHRRLLTGGPN